MGKNEQVKPLERESQFMQLGTVGRANNGDSRRRVFFAIAYVNASE